MKCPKCTSKKTKVTDSRIQGMQRYRMRQCNDCNYSFTTYEIASETLTNQYSKLDNEFTDTIDNMTAGSLVEDDFDLPF